MTIEKITEWLRSQLGDNIQIVSSPIERVEKLQFQYIPTTEQEFLSVIEAAPSDILQGLGFGKWSKMNELISENNAKSAKKPVSIPLLNPEDALESFNPDKPTDNSPMKVENGSLIIQIGREENVPIELLEKDENVWLIPAEWYNVIPDGFIVTGLYGQSFAFQKGKTDDDRRFGCLAYGIRRLIPLPEKS